jgi:hypothetical protein
MALCTLTTSQAYARETRPVNEKASGKPAGMPMHAEQPGGGKRNLKKHL